MFALLTPEQGTAGIIGLVRTPRSAGFAGPGPGPTNAIAIRFSLHSSSSGFPLTALATLPRSQGRKGREPENHLNAFRRKDAMQNFLVALAAIAALTISVQAGAQPAPSTATPPSPAHVQPMNRMPAGGPATSERGATGSVLRAHQRHHAAHSAKTPSAGTGTSASPTQQH